MMYRPVRGSLKPNQLSTLPVSLLILNALISILLLLLAACPTSSRLISVNYKNDSLSTTLVSLNQSAIHVNLTILSNLSNDNLMIILKYQPQAPAQPQARQLCLSFPYKDKPFDIDVRCNSSIELFGYYDDPPDTYSPFLNQLCAPKTIPLQLNNNKTISHTITGLQSNVIYIIRTSLNVDDQEIEFTEGCIHTKDLAPPQYPPQTDLSSFELVDNIFEFNNIILFWRPVPGLLAGNTLTQYYVSCNYFLEPFNSKFQKPNVKAHNGSFMIKLDLNFSYNCIVYAYNNHGESSRKSLIYIPQKSNIYNERMDLQVSALSANKYILQWMKLNDTISSLYPEMNLSDSYYTIYWCIPKRTEYSCSSIEGMKKTRTNIEQIVINKPDASYRLFGVSYSVPQSKYSSGITWSNECLLGKLKSPYSDITSVRSDPTGTKLMVSWREKCDPIKALMIGYLFELCRISNQVLDCFDELMESARGYNSSTKSNMTCKKLYIPKDNRVTEAIFTNLLPGHLYRVSLNVEFQNNTQIPYQNYTDIKFASTTDPRCLLSSSFPHVASLVATITVAICVFGWFYGHYARYRKAVTSLTKVLDKKLEIVSSIDSFDLKYLINRSSSYPHGSLNSNPTLTASFDSSGEPSTAICVSDYVPVNQTDIDHSMTMDEDRLPSSVEDNSDTSWNLDEKHWNWSSFDVSESDSTTNLRGNLMDSDCDDDLSLNSHSSFLHEVLSVDPLHKPTEKKRT